MRVRTRLLLAFAYILLVVVVALEIPFAITLNRRAEREERNRVVTLAQGLADGLELSNVLGDRRGERLRRELQEFVATQSDELGARILVTDDRGIVVADSDRSNPQIGADYSTRPEMREILQEDRAFSSVRRFSSTLGYDILAAAAAVHGVEEVEGVVRLTVDLRGVQAQTRRILIGTAAIGIGGLIAGLVIAALLAGSLSRPLTRLAAAAHRLGEGELDARSGVSVGGEIGEVAATFDAMAERLQRTVQAQREFVANASHQLRTPLTGLKLRLETAAAEAPTDDLRQQLLRAEQEADRLAGIVERLLVMARSVETGDAPAEGDLGQVARSARERWDDRARRAGGSVEVRGTGATAAAAPDDLAQIVDNLVDNALSYAPGQVTIEIGAADGRALLAVEDRGSGIPEDERTRVLERFYRGPGVAPGGSGLGLSIVRDLAARWDGEVRVLAADGGGTRVEVTFPAVEGAS